MAGAAEEVLGALLKRSGQPSMMSRLEQLYAKLAPGEDWPTARREINQARNAFKHATDPDEDEFEFDPGEALAMLTRAAANY